MTNAQLHPTSVAASLAGKRHFEIEISGFGGQGVIMSANILGRVATVEENRNAVMTQSYGPESRGGSCRAAVIIDDGEIGFPRVTDPDVMIILSAAAFDKYAPKRTPRTILIVEENLIAPGSKEAADPNILTVPATRIADDLGRRIVMNIIILGFFCGTTELMSPEALRRGICKSVPSHTEELNMRAFEAGLNYALKTRSQAIKSVEAPS
ncbi:MAG: 2-oxoacid:acceptor oxidoreductase family protein [Bradymonadaceae bacterium]